MSTTATAEKKISAAKALSILKVLTPERVMRAMGKTANQNKQLNKFLSGEFKLPKAFGGTKEEVAKAIDSLLNPSTGECVIITDVENQRKRLDLLTEQYVSTEVALKSAWIKSFNLDDATMEIAAEKLAQYEKTLISAIKIAVPQWRQVYGETVKA